MDLDLPLRRVKLEKFAVIGQPHVAVLGQAIEDIGQRHVAVSMMVAVRLAVGGDVHELGVLSALVEAAGRHWRNRSPSSSSRSNATWCETVAS